MNRAAVRFQSLIQKKLSFVQCALHHGTCDRCSVPTPLKIRVSENAWITGKVSPRPIPRHRKKPRTLKVSRVFRRLKDSTDSYSLGIALSAQLFIGSGIFSSEWTHLRGGDRAEGGGLKATLKSWPNEAFEIVTQQFGKIVLIEKPVRFGVSKQSSQMGNPTRRRGNHRLISSTKAPQAFVTDQPNMSANGNARNTPV
jgi:hypothetical protein